MAADTLLSYGSLAKWPNIPRIKILGSFSAICATGDYADFQSMSGNIQNGIIRQQIHSDVDELSPNEVFSYLHRSVYQKRCDFEPCLCQFVFIGSRDGKTFLGAVDDVGTRWEDDCIATGYGGHIALPLLRQALERKPDGLTRDEAIAVIKDCLRVLFYRECRAINKFQIAEAAGSAVSIGEPFTLDTTWDLEGFAFNKTAIIR